MALPRRRSIGYQPNRGISAPAAPKPIQTPTGPTDTNPIFTQNLPRNPPPAQAPPRPAPIPQGGDPRDSTYWTTVAKLQSQRDQQISSSNQTSAYERTDLQEALRRMTAQKPIDLGNTTSAANRQGLLYSSTLGNRKGTVETNFARQTGDAQQGYDRREAARETARQAILAGYSLDEAAALAAATDRQSQRDQIASLNNALTTDNGGDQTPPDEGTQQIIAAALAAQQPGSGRPVVTGSERQPNSIGRKRRRR